MREDDKKLDGKESNKILISFYLSADIVERLDDVLFYARKNLPVGKRRKLTKSVIYAIGLKMVIEDFHENNRESFLCRAIDRLVEN